MLDSRTEYKARVDSAIMFIHDHMSENLVLENLASAAHFSPFHFHRIFTALVGETPQQFLNRVRLERAANMLIKYSSYSITQIALQCGFSSSAVFARSFKKHFGISANQYRAAEKKPVVELFTTGQQAFNLPHIDIRIENVADWNLAYVSILQGYKYDLICKAWDQLYRWAFAHDLVSAETRTLGISFDDPFITPSEKCRYYACVTIPENIIPQPPIGFYRLSGSKCVIAHTACGVDQIRSVYMYLYRDWLLDSGFQPADLPPYEVYLSTPEDNGDGQYILDVYIPIVPLY